MPNLKEIIGEELYKQLPEETKNKYKEANLEDVAEGAYIPKARFDQVNTEAKDYKKQVTERDKQLSDLKNEFKDAAGLKVKVEELEAANKQKDTDYQDQLNRLKFDNALEQALKGTKAKNTKALKALLDLEKVKLDGDTLLGLEDQVTSLKKEHEYLFEKEVKGTGAFNTGGAGGNGGSNNDKSIGQKLAEARSQEIEIKY